MSFAKYIWEAVVDLVETIGALEDHDVPEIESTDTNSLSSSSIAATSEHERSPANGIQNPESKDANTEDVLTSEESDPESDDDADPQRRHDELLQESSSVLLQKDPPPVNPHGTDRDLSAQIQTLQQENVHHLIWQDKASMIIKKMTEEAGVRKQRARTAKKRAFRARVARQQQSDEQKRQIEESQHKMDRVGEENARAAEAQQSRLLESQKEVEIQKKAREQAAAAVERRVAEVQAKHDEEMCGANSRIRELQATQTFTFTCERDANELREELSRAKEEHTEELVAKDQEIQVLQTGLNDRDAEIGRRRDEVADECRAKEAAIRDRGRLERTKQAADRELKELQTKNERLESERKKAETRALGAEGRAQGLQDQLMASQTRVQHWEALYNKKEEDTRNKILSAYEVSEEDQGTTTKSSKEEGLEILVEQLRQENDGLKENNRCLAAEIGEWGRVWETAKRDHEIWVQDYRRFYDQDKEEALTKERANNSATNEQDSTEQEIRRQCEEEKQKALAAERENCRIQWETQKCSLRGQFAEKLKSHTNQEMQKLRRRAGVAQKKQQKVRKCQVKWVFRQAVSRAVDVERSLLQTHLRNQFQRDLSNYKTQYESEHASSRIHAEAPTDTDPKDQVLPHEEIKKRDDLIDKYKGYLKDAFAAKRKSEDALTNVKKENERLSTEVMAYASQKLMAGQTKTERQITFIIQEQVRAVKLFSEISIMGLDAWHRNLLNELVLANKVVRDLKTTIEEGSFVDYKEFRDRLKRVVDNSDDFDDLDPRERPALHAQLRETYSVVGRLINILKAKRGDTINEDILEAIHSDRVKGKKKQGSDIGSGAISGSSSSANGGMNALPTHQNNANTSSASGPNENVQAAFANTSTPKPTQNPSTVPFTTTTKPPAPESQDEPEYMDSATAHALQGMDETSQDKAPTTQAANQDQPSKGSQELARILSRLQNNAALSSNQAAGQSQVNNQGFQAHTTTNQAPLPGLLALQGPVQTPQRPAGWTDVMTERVRFFVQHGAYLGNIETSMRKSFPSINGMVGVKEYLEHIKAEWEIMEGGMQQG